MVLLHPHPLGPGVPRRPLKTSSSSGCTTAKSLQVCHQTLVQEGPWIEAATPTEVCAGAAWRGGGAGQDVQVMLRNQQPPHLSGQHGDDLLMLHAYHAHHVSFTLWSSLMEQRLWDGPQLVAEGKVPC